MSPVLPISIREFAEWFQKCSPPIGLRNKIAVALSGGPDSTCLLFLLKHYVSNSSELASLTVDHGLQASSRDMAEQCERITSALGLQHITTRIPWSVPPFPPLPSKDERFERIAREARYHVLFQNMLRIHAPILVFGHHADDQAETSLMRLARFTTELGAGGMRRCRRWGMGFGRDSRSLGWAGHEGMNRWILRPLLNVSKDRILATCEEHNLEYVNDPTNFQPGITLRNAVRQLISGNQQIHDSPDISAGIKQELCGVERASRSVLEVDLASPEERERLPAAINALSTRVDDIDRQVELHLKTYRRPFVPGTFVLSTHNLDAIHDSTIRAAMIRRIIRYVSHYPWGSAHADGHGRQWRTEQTVGILWDQRTPHRHRRVFSAGAGVLWTPVILTAEGRVRIPEQQHSSYLKRDDQSAWLASRQPPSRPDKWKTEHGDSLHRDLSEELSEKLRIAETTLSILYDCRFLIRFDLSLMPTDVAQSLLDPELRGSVLVRSRTRWYLPEIIWKTTENLVVLFPAEVLVKESTSRPQHWIKIEWIRPLEAI